MKAKKKQNYYQVKVKELQTALKGESDTLDAFLKRHTTDTERIRDLTVQLKQAEGVAEFHVNVARKVKEESRQTVEELQAALARLQEVCRHQTEMLARTKLHFQYRGELASLNKPADVSQTGIGGVDVTRRN